MIKKIFITRFTVTTVIFIIFMSTNDISIVSAQIGMPQVITENGKETLLLPDSFVEIIKTNFPGFRVPASTDMAGSWVSEKLFGDFPFICWGDFNGDGLTDIAVILLSDKQWKFIIFHRKDQGYLSVYEKRGVINEPSAKIQYPQQIVIRTVKKGEGWAPEAGDIPMEYKHDFDAVAFSVYGNEQLYLSLIYWDKGQYREY